MKFYYIIFMLVLDVSFSSDSSSNTLNRSKRQGFQFGFGIPNASPQNQQQGGVLGFGLNGQALGGAVNSLLQGFLGGGQQGRPQQPGNQRRGCDQNNGGCQQLCRFLRGRTECGCNAGYFLSQDQRTCSDFDECSNSRPCQEICTNTVGSYTCSCAGGRTLRPDGSCVAAAAGSSCSTNNGGCQQTCSQRRGGAVRCGCNPGYTLSQNRVSCGDVDECASGLHDCGALQCVNTDGDYDCVTRSPSPIVSDPCLTNNGGCQHICVNVQGGVQCQCQPGYQLVNEKTCEQITTTTPATTTTTTSTPATTTTSTTASTTTTTTPPPPTPAVLPTSPGVPLPPEIIPSVPTAPSESGCGINNKKSLFVRIVGGKPADPKDWPWMAALLKATEGTQFCGGTLISNRHVLTAAHCVVSFTSKDLRVRLGEYSFSAPDENSPTDFKVEEIRKHESYSTETQENDIALLKLDRVTTFSEFIWPACLPPPENKFEDQLGYVTGWGTIYFGGPVSQVLQEVVIPVWKQEDCVAAYPDNTVTNSMMCCGRKTGGVDSCQGDSGGPFLIQIFPGKRWYVAGIVSWGIECASPNRPGVYTRVNHYLDWIKENSTP